MSEIAELENRLSAALDRIVQGVDRVAVAGAGAAATASEVPDLSDTVTEQAARIAELEAALTEERAAKVALQEEVDRLTATVAAVADQPTGNADIDALKKAHADEVEYLRAVSASEREAWEGLNSRLVRMRRTNKLMRGNAAALRQAAVGKVVEADVINQSLQTELEALQAAHDLERAEADVILKTLQPLLGDPEKDSSENEIGEVH